MRKQYLKPEIELIQFNYRDVVAASENWETDPNPSDVPLITFSYGVSSSSTEIGKDTSANSANEANVWSDGSTDNN